MNESKSFIDVCEMSAMILAAGCSSRMNAFKPLLRFGNVSTVKMCVDTFKKAGIEDIIVVTGHEGYRIAQELKESGVRCIHNEEYQKGMFSSVKAGVEVISPCSKGFFMLPVDMPMVVSETIKTLVKSFNSEEDILYPTYDGRRGHPPLIGCGYRKAILDYTGQGGLRALISTYEHNARIISVDDEGVIMDMDTKEQYEQLVKLYEARESQD